MHRALALTVAIALCASAPRSQSTVAQVPLQVGLDGAQPVVGDFAKQGDDLILRSADRYDCTAAVGRILVAHATLQVELTHLDGLVGGGLVFGARETDRAPLFAEMVRFDGPGEVLHGSFADGQFEATGRVSLPHPIRTGTRTTLRIDLDADRARMDLWVDGTRIATGLPLATALGGVFVQGSMGRVAFHRVSAIGDATAPRLAWPDAFLPQPDQFVLRGMTGLFALPRDGGAPVALDPDAPVSKPYSSTEIRGARIVAGAVEFADGARFVGRRLGRFRAVALMRDYDDTVLALDSCTARVVAIPAAGDEGVDRLEFRSPTEVRLVPPRACFVRRADGSLGGSSSADGTIAGLEPGTRYELLVPLEYRVWPADLAFRSIPFTTPAPAGSMRIRRLDIVVGLFGNVAAEDDERAELPQATAFDYARLENEIRATCAWYFHHSGFHLWLEPHFVRREEPTTTRALSGSGEPNGEPPRALLVALAEQAKLPLDAVTGFCVVMDAKTRDGHGGWRRIGGGGGLTLGAHGTGYGRSWFFVPKTQGMVSWLFCHELHHQIDALFEIAGLPEYPFNHFAPSLRNVAFFGEHWEGNAWILQQWPTHLWDTLRHGTDVVVADADGDGVPDADARLPFDEDRFGSDPARKDTDGDGLDDFAESRLGRWIVDSGFESQLGPPLLPDPRHADTDGDGLGDAVDPLPLLPFPPTLRSAAPTHLRDVNDPRLHVDCALALSADTLEVRSTCDEPADLDVQVLLDADADGWFAGADNYRIRAHGDRARVIECVDASSITQWPHADVARARGLAVSARLEGRTQILSIPLPRGARDGRSLGLAIAFRSKLCGDDDPRWFSLFEPHRLVAFCITEGAGR
ncbi:MAG: hypothetical protein U1F36_03500 [Planctomycetota bacterium]